MNVTLKQVAKLAGVSPSTVSRTISDHPSISAQTKIKVRKAMEELGYEASSSTPTIQDSKTIGVILPASDYDAYENVFFLETIRGISLFCNSKQYTPVLITGSTNQEIINALKSMSIENKLDGVILLYSKEEDSVLEYLNSEGILYIILGKAKRNTSETIYIDNDNIAASREAANYLINMGHERISYIGMDTDHVFSADRKAGYMLAMAEHGLPVNPDYIIELPLFPKTDAPEIRTLLERDDRPTAIIVCDDMYAMVLMQIAAFLNLRIPEELSIVSFNNTAYARFSVPQLTSIDVNSQQLGIEAASQIINHIENPTLLATKIIVPHFLVERESCAPVK